MEDPFAQTIFFYKGHKIVNWFKFQILYSGFQSCINACNTTSQLFLTYGNESGLH